MTSRTIPDVGTDSFTYDLAGKLMQVGGPAGTLTHSYDAAGRLTGVTDTSTRSVGYSYDAASHRTRLIYPDGSYVQYYYDQLGRLTSVSYDSNADDQDPAAEQVAAYTYDDHSRRTGITRANNAATSYTYTLTDQLNTLGHTFTGGVSATLGYGYDDSGLRNSLTANDQRFAPLFMGTGTADYAPNNLNQYATAGGVTQNYDGNGNLRFDGQSTYTNDAVNRMTGAQTAEHTATYVFDSFDRRISKTVDGSTAAYLFDGDHIVAEYESGALARKFVYGPGIDEPLMMIIGENRYFYHANEQGSVLALSNASGALAETYLYSPYGELGFEAALGNPYLYTGRRYDPETGLYYYRARMYSATMRRFLQPDPIGYAGGMNMYAYVGNNPVMYVDPYGLDPEMTIRHSAGIIVNNIIRK